MEVPEAYSNKKRLEHTWRRCGTAEVREHAARALESAITPVVMRQPFICLVCSVKPVSDWLLNCWLEQRRVPALLRCDCAACTASTTVAISQCIYNRSIPVRGKQNVLSLRCTSYVATNRILRCKVEINFVVQFWGSALRLGVKERGTNWFFVFLLLDQVRRFYEEGPKLLKFFDFCHSVF